MRWLAWLLLAALLVASPARADEAHVYVHSVPDLATFERYSRVLGSDRFGKFIIDVKTDDIYFIDVNLFKLHADFVLGVLLHQAWTAENIREYNKNYERDKPHFILGYLTYHQKIDLYTFSFWEGDAIDADTIERVYKKLGQTFFVKEMTFRPDSPKQEEVAKEVARRGIKVVTNDKIYKSARYQAFNKGSTVGTLRVVPVGTSYDALLFERTDVVLLQESYPDITPVAGILSAVFSTPLSHVNLRARAWGIPNAGNADARRDYAKLDGQVVVYEVRDDGMTLRAATPREIEAHKNQVTAARTVKLPAADTSRLDLAMLDEMRAADTKVYGTKAANLGEIVSAKPAGVNVPMGFGIPFFYYLQHLRRNRLDTRIDAMLADPRWKTDAAWRKTELASLRAAIQKAPIEPRFLTMLDKRVRRKLGGKGVFVRSSTNAEDLEGFNGAGLYDTVPNVKGKRALGEAVKTVWASVWNLRAVEERELFGIDHRAVFAGVLVQIGINSTASGVLVTANLFDPEDDHSYTINAKRGLGMRVVEGKSVPEQVVFDTWNDGTKIVSRSDDPVMLVFDEKGGIREVPNPNRGVILSEARAKRLADMVGKIVPLFPRRTALDVEWVLEGEKVWIVQARPYVSGR